MGYALLQLKCFASLNCVKIMNMGTFLFISIYFCFLDISKKHRSVCGWIHPDYSENVYRSMLARDKLLTNKLPKG